MNYQEMINEISVMINDLTKKRAEVINKRNNFDEDKVKSLEWTKGIAARLSILRDDYGVLPKYEILMSGNVPETFRPIHIMGDSSFNQENVLYKNGSFYTNSSKLLISFLEKVKFKRLDYDNDSLEVLLKAKERNNS